MTTIVRPQFPSDELPASVKQEFPAGSRVTLIVVSEQEGAAQPFSSFRSVRRSTFSSIDEVVDHVRALRDEWT